jgi:CRISPR-associated exonuclease Cas4
MTHTITATLISYYHTCRRKLWLHANDITMEHQSDLVYAGKLIGENSYNERPAKGSQLELKVPLDDEWTGAAKIDFYDAHNHTVHETKKSDKLEEGHEAQVKFYLYLLGKSGIAAAKGIIEYPKLRHRKQIQLTDDDKKELEHWIDEVKKILLAEQCPPIIHKPWCKQCAYFEFCFTREEDQ